MNFRNFLSVRYGTQRVKELSVRKLVSHLVDRFDINLCTINLDKKQI